MVQREQILDENMGTFFVGSVGIKCTVSHMINTGSCFNERLAKGVNF